MITSAYTFAICETGTDRLLGSLTVNTISRSGGALIARAVMADRFGLDLERVAVMQGVVEIAGLVSNPGEDFRERARLDKLARRAARKFRRLSADERAMVMPAVLRAVCPGMPLVILRDAGDCEQRIRHEFPGSIAIVTKKRLGGDGAAKRDENMPDFISRRIARNGDVR